jgi:hypothetical protein
MSLKMIQGDVNNDDTVCGVGEGVDATVCKISPILMISSVSSKMPSLGSKKEQTWHVTAVHGSEPIKEPRKQSRIATPQTPQAMLIPDHGTTPMRRRMLSLTQAGDDDFTDAVAVGSDDEVPSNACLVMSSARGIAYVRNGASGAARSVAQMEPRAVSTVMSSVA